MSLQNTGWLIGIRTMTPLQKNSGIFDGSLGIVPDVLIATSMLTGRDECHVAIRVSDRAGGIPSDVGDRIWFES